ncbi:MAG: FUSC family protein [Methanobacterium sp.]
MSTIIKARMLLKKSHPTPKISSMIEIARLLVTTRLITSGIKSNLNGKAAGILKEFLNEVNKLSKEVANAVITDNKNLNLDITILNKKINELATIKELDNETRLIVLKNMEKYLKIFEKSQKILEGDLILDIPPLLFSSQASSLEKLKANFNLSNMYIRHGIRFAIALGLAFMVTLVTNSFHAFWITITVFFVLKPDISSSLNEMIVRVIATIVGVILAIIISGILVSLGLSIVIYGFIVLTLAVMSAYKNGYIFLVALTMFLIFLLTILQPGNILASGLARFEDIIIGSAIAFAVGYFILPSRLRVDLKLQVVKRLESNIDYIDNAIIPAFENTASKKKINLAIQEMLLSYNNLKAGIKKVIDSFDDAGEDIKVLNSIAEANDRLSRDLSALVNKINASKDIHPIWEPTTVKIEQILTDLKNSVENGTDLQPLPDSGSLSVEIEEMKMESGDMDSKIVFEYLKWIMSDIYGLYGSIRNAKDKEIFKKYKNL